MRGVRGGGCRVSVQLSTTIVFVQGFPIVRVVGNQVDEQYLTFPYPAGPRSLSGGGTL